MKGTVISMLLNKNNKILIVGLGLIGGSYAQALSHLGFEVGAIDLRQEAIDYAAGKGWIASGRVDNVPEYLAQFDLIVFALYPRVFVKWLEENQIYLKKGALLTDVTGVKVPVVYKVQSVLREDLEFIAAHPMAGRERSGVENADMAIFREANYIVTPTEKNSPEAVETCKQLGRLLGFRTITELSPEKHDEIIGFLSQLTHCIAVSLMTSRDTQSLAAYSGDSFRDLTRIAKINDEMWSELFLLNKEELLRQMEQFQQSFQRLYHLIETDQTEEIRGMMRFSTLQRKNFDKKKS